MFFKDRNNRQEGILAKSRKQISFSKEKALSGTHPDRAKTSQLKFATGKSSAPMPESSRHPWLAGQSSP